MVSAEQIISGALRVVEVCITICANLRTADRDNIELGESVPAR
jgi:hypothetical protein